MKMDVGQLMTEPEKERRSQRLSRIGGNRDNSPLRITPQCGRLEGSNLLNLA